MFKTVLIIILVCAFLLSLYIIFYKQIRLYTYGFFKQRIIKSMINKIAHNHDYLYISQSKIHVNKSKDTSFDNILVTPKNVYVIKNVYYYGILMAKEVDEKWILNQGKGRTYVDNPLNLNNLRMKLLSENLNIPFERMKNVILYGESLDVYSMELNPRRDSVFISYKEFEKKLNDIEANSDNYFTDQQQEEIINNVYNMNKQSLSYRKENR